MSFFLRQPLDYRAHNAEVARLMEAFNAGRPYRVPVQINGSITNYLLNPELNVQGWSFQDYFEDPDVQIKAQLEYQKWCRFNLLCDTEMGLPEHGWPVYPDFQNSYDAGWVGCPIRYFEGRVPDTEPILAERKERLYELPEHLQPTAGLLGRALEYYEYMHEACEHLEYEGRPVVPPAEFLGESNDGPLDLAYKLRGAENLLVDMLTDEPYYHDLMEYITRNLIQRMRKLRELRWARFPDSADEGLYRDSSALSDDALALISLAHYKEFVYPYHRRMYDEFTGEGGVFVHLCGDATRHFRFMKEIFNVTAFDTGFPVDHGWLRQELGTEVLIYGGPTVMVIKDGRRQEIESEVLRICRSGVMEGGRFILIAANNLAPCTPVENVVAMYEAAKMYGVYGER